MSMGGIDDNSRLGPVPADEAASKGYEVSGKIMMSAIIVAFAVIFVMVFINIYARWLTRRSGRRRHSRRTTHLVFDVDPNNPDSTVSAPSRGLDAAVINTLPTFAFSSAADEENVPECAVCLSEFQDGEKGRLLPKCNHSFHVDCIDMWFHSHSTCPLCRAPVEAQIPTSADQNAQVEVVVELSESSRSESTHLELPTSSNSCSDCLAGPSSLGGRRKGLDPLEVPARTANFAFPISDEVELGSSSGQGFKSPTSRLLSFKRILSREKKPIPSPTSYSSGIGTSCSELADIEAGRVDARTSRSQATTPR